MTRTLLIAALSGLVAACASTGSERPAVCDGRHRRPANLYGSLLSPPGPPPALATPSSSAAPDPAAPAPQAPPSAGPQPSAAAPPHDQLSALPSSFPSC